MYDEETAESRVFEKKKNYTTKLGVQRRYGETEGGVVEEKKDEIPGGRK